MVKPVSNEDSQLSRETPVLRRMITKRGEGTVALEAGALQGDGEGGWLLPLGTMAVQGGRGMQGIGRGAVAFGAGATSTGRTL